MNLGRVGIWSAALRLVERAEAVAAAAELEELGFGALWLPGRAGTEVFDRAADILAATSRIVVATGIVSIWTCPAAEAAAAHHRVTHAHPGRFLLGLGVSHQPMVDAQEPGRYRRPVALTEAYLDELDAGPQPPPASELVLAALGPRMLDLARRRTAGSHPYLVPPSHTAFAREILGPGALLAPEQPVVLETDPARARELARGHLANPYLGLPNYRNNWLRLGFTEADLADGGSDRLVDGIVAWGSPDTIARRVAEHHDAGADHVCVQVLNGNRESPATEEWRRLAEALTA